MKKLLCLALCLVLSLFALVSCGPDEIGGDLDKYPPVDTEIPEVTLNLYIIVGDGTVDNAKTTVSRMILQHTRTTYSTLLNVHYVSEAEYAEKALAAVNSTDANAANIVLVNSSELMYSLKDTGKLLALDSYLATKDFGKLNVSIPSVLMNAAKIDNALYAIPNNHVIGEYKYLVIDKEKVHQELKVPMNELLSLNVDNYDAATLDAKIAELNAKIGADAALYVDSAVTGPYALKAELEKQGKVCNVIGYPVATPDIAFASAFAIVNKDELSNTRAMQIVYALNADAELRNLLQYGVSGTNYEYIDNNVVLTTSADNIYRMNLIYTGDIFLARNCAEIGWTPAAMESGKSQNIAAK